MKKFLLLILFCLSTQTYASCQSGISGDYGIMNVTFGSVIVAKGTAIGDVLATQNTSITSVEGCSEPWTLRWVLNLFTTQSSIDGIYDTNVRGVGLKITGYGGVVMPFDTAEGASVYSGGLMGPFIIQLIKTSSGSVDAGVLINGKLSTNSIVGVGEYAEIDLVGINKIIPEPCSITTPNLVFPIGNVLAGSFGNTVGFTPPQTSTQNLGLDCDADANINVALNATQNPDVAETSVLALDNQGSAGTASGLGVQLLYNGSPLVINENIFLKKSAGGQETFPITARYYQTKPAVTVGEANTSATLQLTYQ